MKMIDIKAKFELTLDQSLDVNVFFKYMDCIYFSTFEEKVSLSVTVHLKKCPGFKK